jgi:hypothetical protein
VSTRSRRSRGRRFPHQPVQRDLPADAVAQVDRLDLLTRCDMCREPALPDPTCRNDLGLPDLVIRHAAGCPAVPEEDNK